MKRLSVAILMITLGLIASAFTDDMSDCIGTQKYQNNLSQSAAVKVCMGVKDKQKIKDCVGRNKYSQNMMSEEDVVNACAQGGVIRVIE